MPELVELLFFDTFAHDNTEEINLDLVQFPKPVYITEVRIIPLGARVQADFPGGVRLGATNPSQFKIEFFVNDLGKPGASTFESLGDFEYNQNGCINLDCSHEQDSIRRIPTDGLVLRGWYTTITLAVYGTLTNNITEQIVQPVVANPATLPAQPSTIPDPQKIITVGVAVEPEWSQENVAPVVVVAPPEYVQNNAPYQAPPPYVPPETVYSSSQEYSTEYYSDVPKDPRSYHHTPETEWDTKRSRVSDIDRDKERDRDRERSRDAGYQKSSTNEKDHGRSGESDRRDRDRTYTSSSSHGRDRDRTSREYREVSREQDWDHDRADYGRTTTADWDRERSHGRDRDRGDRDRDRDRGVDRDRDRGDRDRDRDRFYKHGDENYRRSSYNRDDRDGDRKRPRTPPIQSPKRPHTPLNERKETTSSPPEIDSFSEEELVDAKKVTKEEELPKSPASKEVKEPTPPVEEPVQQMDVEEFEPILSDEDILDEDVDYDYNTYTNNDDLIKLFVPGATPLRKFEIETFKITNVGITIDENLKIQIGIVDDYFKSSITKYTLKDFTKLTVEIKEEFIHLCEKLINIFSSADNFVDIVKLYTLAKSVNTTQFSADDKELLEQINCGVESVVDWLIIALNYEMANIQDQPAYKIRHIKCGVRLAEWCCNSEEFVRLLWDYKFNMHEVLLDLYDQEYMAMSIKLMIVKALDTYLSHKFAIEKFLIRNENCKENGFHGSYHATPRINGYKAIVEKILKNSSVRLKFALHSVLIKLNLYEVFNKMSAILTTLRNSELSKDDVVLLVKLLEQIQNAFQGGQFVYSQPKRFLPVSAQFEIGQQVKNVSVNFFKMFDIIQSFFLLLSCKASMNLETIKNPVLEILCQLSRSKDGLDYLSQNCETLNSLLKCLLQSDEELYSLEDCVKSQNVGVEIAYKVETLYYVESLDKIGHDYDDPEVVNQLHGLFCLTFTHAGRLACAEVLSMEDNIKCLLQFFSDIYVKDKSESVANKIKKSPGMAYIIDVIAATVVHTSNVPFLETYYKHLNQLVEYQYLFEDTTKFNEIQAYLTPLDNIVLHYDNISHFVDIVNKEVENATAFSGELITSLRILQYLGISQHPLNTVCDNMLRNYVELKYKHVILQLFSLDGVTILTKLLQKICDHYKQPTLYTSIFVSNRGLQIINAMKPCVELLKHMLSYVIQCQNTNFKDLTAIPVLLQSYTLLSSFPSTTYAHLEAQSICSSIIDTLLVYTQPISDEIHEKDSLNKTLWSLMCGEAIKYVTQSPCTYLSGLLILSEILPLPLPIEANDDLSQDEILWAVNLRRLWSAHLHPHCGNIQDLIGKLCTTSHHQLLNLLRRVCVQLADLAANSALMITRGILDVIHKALVIDDSKVEPCSSHSARLLNFLACLVTHSTIKCSILHLLHNSSTKGDEKYPALVQVFMHILKQSNSSTSHIQAQECILSIIQSFCDVEITLLQNPPKITTDLYLSNALPMKEQLLIFISTMVEHLQMDNSLVTHLQVLRTLILLTEHDYGFYHLTEQLNRKGNIFGVLLNKLVGTFSKENAECLSTINTLVEFLQICSATEEVEAPLLYTPRKMKMSISEVAELIGWKKPVEGDGEDTTHPLLLLQDHLKKICDEDITFEALHDGITTLKNLLQLEQPDSKETPFVEPILPEPEPLLGQFSARSVFIRSTDALNERLTIRYWLPAASDEVENENITCDLTEITRQFLPQEFNLIREIEKLCRICPLENVSEKERHDDHKTKMKKTFVTPMRSRGFPRTVQQRSDLFRSRPPNTSRPPSLHVDDFVALETCGAQPTGPTGYNKFSRDLLASSRIGRGSRGRTFVMSERSVHCRQMTWWGTSLVRRPYQ